MSELLDKQMNVKRKVEKNFWGSHKLLQAHDKVYNENKEETNKQK